MSLLNEARTYRERGEYHLALTCAQGAPEPAGRLEQARILIWLGRYEDARRLAQNGLLTLPDHPLALIVNSEAHVACGQPAEAVALARKACDAAQDDPSLGGMAHIGMAHIALASALHSNGQGEDAVATAQQALTSLDSGRPYDRALASQTLAESFHVASNYAEAANAWRRTLDLRREILDHDHPEIAVTINGMALTVRRLGLVSTAAELHEDALSIYEAHFDEDHPAIAACRHGLAQALHRLGKAKQARDHMARALASSERRQGIDHIHTWVTRFELGRLEADAGDLATGYRRMEASRLRLTEKLGADHPTVQAIRRWMR